VSVVGAVPFVIVAGGAVLGGAVGFIPLIESRDISPAAGSAVALRPNGQRQNPDSWALTVLPQFAQTNTTVSNAHAVGRTAFHASRKVWPGISARRVRAKMHGREFARTRGGRFDSRESGREMSQKLRRAPRLVFP
jgi:hypothetical protein